MNLYPYTCLVKWNNCKTMIAPLNTLAPKHRLIYCQSYWHQPFYNWITVSSTYFLLRFFNLLFFYSIFFFNLYTACQWATVSLFLTHLIYVHVKCRRHMRFNNSTICRRTTKCNRKWNDNGKHMLLLNCIEVMLKKKTFLWLYLSLLLSLSRGFNEKTL